MSNSTPSPALAESSLKEEDLRALVDAITSKDRQASMSPRSAVLSHSSLQTGPISDHPSDLANGAVDTRGQLRKRSKGKGRQREGREVAWPTALSQLVDVDISRKDPTDEVMRLRQILKTVEKLATSEARRSKELQRVNQDVQRRFQQLNENKILAEQEAAKAKQEIRLFQYQLDNAQKEIERSQEAVKNVEKQRDEAEAAAARARAKARKLHEEQMILAAREEGRRLGFDAGFEHARAERETIAARRPRPRANIIEATTSNHSDKGKGKERAYPQDEEATYPRRTFHAPNRPPARERDDIISSPDSPEMSPSQLPLRNLPPMNMASDPIPRTQPNTSQSTPLRPFRPPTDSELDSPTRYSRPPLQRPQQLPEQHPPQPQPRHQPSQPQLQTPDILHWTINDLPPASQIQDFNPSENPRDTIASLSKEKWVTAQKHRELTETPPQFQRKHPPSLLPPPRQPAQPNSRNSVTPTKAVKFPNLSRPSLAKTKQQAASWYRRWSQRNKAKPVIDPIFEEPTTTPTTEPPVTASTVIQSEPPSATEPPTTAGSEMYGPAQQLPTSWYQAKQPSGSAAPSVRSQDYGYTRRRPTSDMLSMSTRVSQFDLLSTPAQAAQSVRSGKEGKKVKEKESYLSVIREDPSSRGNTPSTDRHFPAGGMPRDTMRTDASSLAPPDFRQPSLHQQSSYATTDTLAQNRRHSRRPPSIAVPDPDDALEPAGIAYARHSQSASGSASGRQGYPELSRRPSRISEKTTPDTSIVIDVVPPSAFAPDVIQSPPHTGRNHLSPYHVYQPPPQGTSRIAPAQSVASLRTQGSSRLEPPSSATDRHGSAADPRRKSKQSLNSYAAELAAPAYPSSPRMNARPPSVSSRAPSGMNGQYMNTMQPYTPPPQGRPESVRSSASRKPPPPMASQTSLLRNPGPSGLTLESPMQHKKSSTSMRSMGSYSKYDPDGYEDPAFWAPDGPDGTMPVQSQNAIHGRIQTRPPSANSGLSYLSNR